MLNFLKSWTLVISMLLGILLSHRLIFLSPAIPYLISVMLFITFSKVNFSAIRLSTMHYLLFAIQIISSIIVYVILKPISITLAQGAMVCILIPTATSASVVVGILGGNVSSIAAYTLFNSLAGALLIPIIFSTIGISDQMTFLESLTIICKSVLPMFFIPLSIAWVINNYLPVLRKNVERIFPFSFYMWAFALMIVTGKTADSIINQHISDKGAMLEIALGVAALLICIAQFWIGKKIGRKYNQRIEAGQGMGQKNTIFGIWLAQMYLVPQAALAPACYVLWQNLTNSFEIWRTRREAANKHKSK